MLRVGHDPSIQAVEGSRRLRPVSKYEHVYTHGYLHTYIYVSILSFRRVLYVVCFLLGISQASEV